MATFKRKPKFLTNIDALTQTEESLSNINNAQQLLRAASANGISGIPVKVREIAKLFNIALRSSPMDQEKSGYIKIDEERWIIGVNSLHHPKRQRFTIAHELGHYFLHREIVEAKGKIEDGILFRANGFGDISIEREANEFAAELLMPEDDFKRIINESNRDVRLISDRLDVSSMAVAIRAKNI